jgi:hypothetical protein
MTDVDRVIARGLWRSWKTGGLPTLLLFLAVIGVAVGPDWRPSSPQEAVRQEQRECQPLLRSDVSGADERRAWDALVDAGWHDEGSQIVAPGCRGVAP